jgi:hypothetical protein
MPEHSRARTLVWWSDDRCRTVALEHVDRAAERARRRSHRDRPDRRIRAHAQALGHAATRRLSGAIRVASGEIDGLRPKWGRGYGRWVRDVLVWTKAPFLFRNELVAADGVDEQRPANRDEIRRLGDHPTILRLKVGTAMAEVAADGDDSELVLGPYRKLGAP